MRINEKNINNFYIALLAVFSIIFLSSSNNILAVDGVAPSAVANLSVFSVDNSNALLSWRSPGDDGGSQQSEYVIVISVDGMGSYYVQPLLDAGDNQLTNFLRIMNEGSGTLNARDDANYANTLPNHVTMATSRGVSGESGHNWTKNTTVLVTDTLENNKGSYIASFFDVAHDNGLRTGIWAGKSKFNLFQQSYSTTAGANDMIGFDNGKDKIDYDKVTNGITAANLTTDFLSQMASNPFNLSFVHFQDPDAVGHSSGWSTDTASAFASVLKAVDTQIGNILDAIEASPTLNGKTTVIITADHGGHDTTHGDITNNLDYTIPFYVWGADVSVGDLYTLNSLVRTAPAADANPNYSGSQPIRNGEAGNLALSLLGLSAIPGSTINSSQDLVTENFGTATIYDIRYNTSTITNENWESTTQATGEPSPVIAGTTQTFSVTGLSSDNTYYFALKTSDEVPNTSTLSNITSVLMPPNSPSECSTVRDSDTQFTITWTDNSSVETGFKIERKIDGGDWVQIGTDNSSPYVDNTTLINHSYQYRIRAYNGSGNSNYSTDENIFYTTPSSPTIGTPVANSSTSITWNWTDNSNYEDYFKLHFTLGSETTIDNIDANLISYVSSGLFPNTQYSAHVHSYRTDRGESLASDDATIYTLANVPSSLALTVNSASYITATWLENYNSTGTYYYIENITAGTNSGWITEKIWASSGLTCNTSYSFKVKSKNGDNVETAYSDIVTATTATCSSGGGGGGGGGGWTPPIVTKDITSFGFLNATGTIIGTNILVKVPDKLI